jgi:hypothetical protein
VYLGKGVTGSQGYIIHIHKTCACTGLMCKNFDCVSVYLVYLWKGVTGYHLYLDWVGQSVCQDGSMFHVNQGWDRDYPYIKVGHGISCIWMGLCFMCVRMG